MTKYKVYSPLQQCYKFAALMFVVLSQLRDHNVTSISYWLRLIMIRICRLEFTKIWKAAKFALACISISCIQIPY